MIWGTFEGIIRGPGRTQNKKPPQSAEYKKTFRGGGLIITIKKLPGKGRYKTVFSAVAVLTPPNKKYPQ